MQYAYAASTVEDFRIRWGIPDGYNPYWHYEQYYEEELPIITRMRFLDLMTYLPEDILTKVDRVCMAVSLECLSGNELKGCLKDAYRGIVPDEVLYGIKMGFGVPDHYLWREKHEKNLFAGILKTQWSGLDESRPGVH